MKRDDLIKLLQELPEDAEIFTCGECSKDEINLTKINSPELKVPGHGENQYWV